MSTTTGTTAGAADDDAIKTAMGSLLDKAQAKISFPIGNHDDDDSDEEAGGDGDDHKVKTSASRRLTYNVSGHLIAQLSTDWEIVPGFTLNSVELSVDAYYGSESINRSLSASLTANATVAGCLLSVKGELPDLRKDAPTEFTLSVAVLAAEDLATPEDVAEALAGDDTDLGLGPVIGGLDKDVAGALRNPSATQGALFAKVTVLRTTDGTYFVKEVRVSVAARFEWAPIERLKVTNASVDLRAWRTTAQSDWEYAAKVSGKMEIGQAVATVVGKLNINVGGAGAAAENSAEVTVRVEARRGVSAKKLISELVGEEAAGKVTGVPPDLPDVEDCLEGTSAAAEAVVRIEKGAAATGSGWGIKNVAVKVELSGFVWEVVDGFAVQDIAFALLVTRGPATESGESSESGESRALTARREESGSGTENKWVFKGWVGATMSMREGQFIIPVSISYDSNTDLVTIKGTLPDDGYGQLTALAADPSLLTLPENEGGVEEEEEDMPDLLADSADKHPVTTECPLHLSDVASPTEGKDRGLLLQFTSTTLTRARFEANHNVDWQVTENLKITHCGIMFDVKEPRDKAKRNISGYVYGSATIGQDIKLFAFAAGMKDKTDTAFWLGFSVDYEPEGSLGVKPTDLISDQKFCGEGTTEPDSAGWDVGSFPGKPDEVVKNAKARVLVKFAKDTEGDEAQRKTRLRQVKVNVAVGGTWQIWEGLELTDAHLNVLVERRKGIEGGYDWAAELFGAVRANGTYRVQFLALAKHDVKETSMAVAVTLVKETAAGEDKPVVPSPKALTETGVLGKVTPEKNETDGTIPDNYPIQPNSLTNTTSTDLAVTARVKKVAGGKFSLESLTFSLSTSNAWTITSTPRIVLERAALDLIVTKTGDEKRAVTFVALGYLKIGSSLAVLTTLQFSSNAKKLSFTVTTGTPADLMSTLVTRGSSAEIVPNGFPPVLNTHGDHFKLAVDADKGETSWGLGRVELDVNVRPAWELGEHAKITGITLKAKFTKATGGWDKEVSIVGEVMINGTPVKVTATLNGEKVTLEVRGVTAVDAAALAGPETAELVRTAPAIPSDTGVEDYKDRGTRAVLTFLKNGGGYRVDSVALQVGTTEGFQWVIIKPTLVLQKVYASVSVENIGRGAKLQLCVHGDLYVKKSASRDGVVSVDLTAKKESMHLGLDMSDGSKQTKEREQVTTLGGCNITELLYMITAGGAALDIDLGPRIVKVDLDLVWKNKTGTFKGSCADWNLSDVYPDLVGMKEPSLTLSYVRRGRLSGSLDGYLGLLGGRVSMSYGIPKGPLLIAGINVKKAVELAKKLFKLFRKVKNVVMTIFKIVRTVGTVIAVAKMVGPALIALGAATGIVWAAFAIVFGSGGAAAGAAAAAEEGAKWVVGGPGRTVGIKSETVELYIYPVDYKKKDGPGELQVQIIPNTILGDEEAIKAVPVINSFTAIENGWSCTYTRPATLGDYQIRVGTPGDLHDFDCAVTETPSLLGPQSRLEAHGPVISRRGYAYIFPKDTASRARFGHKEDSAAFAISMGYEKPELQELHPEGVAVAVNWLNDSIKLSFEPPTAGTYQLSVKLDGVEIEGSPATVEVHSAGDPTYSIAYGEGLCSGVADQETGFSVVVHDQFNAILTAVEEDTCVAFLEGAGEDGQDLKLPAAVDAASGHVTFKYTRPKEDYDLRILVNERPLDMSPITLKVTAEAAVSTTNKSGFTLPLPPYHAETIYIATIEAHDQFGERFRASTGNATNLAVTIKKWDSSEAATTMQLVDHLDGSYDVSLRFEEAGRWKVCCDVPTTVHEEGMAIITTHEFMVFPPVALTNARCYGTGLSSGLTGAASFNVRGLDQAGKNFPIVENDEADFQVLLQHGVPAELTVRDGVLHIDYIRPETDNIIAVLYKGQHVSGSPFLVPTAATAVPSIDPQRCVLTSNLDKVGELFTALLVAIDTDGRRMFTGGHKVLATSKTDTVVDIVDRGDGTYAIEHYPDPANDGETALHVTVEEFQLTEFIPARVPATPKVEDGAAKQGEVAELRIHGMGVGEGALMGKMVIMTETVIVEVMDVEVSGTDNLGLRSAHFTVPTSVEVGTYTCKLFILAIPVPGMPFFSIAVEEPTPPTTFTVEGLPLYIGNYGDEGTFTVVVNVRENEEVDVQKLSIETANTKPEMLNDLAPRFETEIDSNDDKKVNVKVVVVIGGAITLGLTYDETTIEPPQDGWMVYSSDASKTITHHLPPSVPVPASIAWAVSSQEGIKANLTADLLTFTKSSSQYVWNQWAEAVLKLPGVVTSPGFAIVYDLRWTTLTGTSEVKLHSPVPLADDTSLLLRYADGRVSWVTFERNGGFQHQGNSSVTADGRWHRIMFYYEQEGQAGEVAMEIRNVVTVPTGFHLYSDEPSWRTDMEAVEVIFNEEAPAWRVDDDASEVRPELRDEELQFNVPESGVGGTMWMKNTARFPLNTTFSIVQCRLRVTAPAPAGDTRVTLFGGATLRFSEDRNPTWMMEHYDGMYTLIAESRAFHPNSVTVNGYVVVTLVGSENEISCWEDGMWVFSWKGRTRGLQAEFGVGWLAAGRESVVGISHFRGLVEGGVV
ncbi:uncharacterized protein LAJ45_11335 [Morchella importuna]|uniref:uncharacterized protein n=1 Tax=Morchella importuna TaxID=1174673 RepID=UPI001E8D8889|nr:uncharacterized protein LAJ45_11335 [Morchella importuna]KAH8144674.1 hypothetical protein LAJ45_11335 [Morchella importuna]